MNCCRETMKLGTENPLVAETACGAGLSGAQQVIHETPGLGGKHANNR